jgi:hypothetical protein
MSEPIDRLRESDWTTASVSPPAPSPTAGSPSEHPSTAPVPILSASQARHRLPEGTEAATPIPPAGAQDTIAGLRLRATSSRFDLRQQWEGTVVSIDGDSFSVTLRDLTDASVPEESAELLLEDVSDSDRELLEPGAVFYWSVGYEETFRGRERKSIIRFRRLPGWTRQQLKAVQDRAEELNSYFSAARPKANVQ